MFLTKPKITSVATFIWVAIALISIIAGLIPEVTKIYQYDRNGILNGEIWRIITGNFVHWTSEHLIWDLLVFISLSLLACRLNAKRYILCMIFISVGIFLCLITFLPEIIYYRGLSGIDSGLFTLILISIYFESKDNKLKCAGITGIILFGGKTIYEIIMLDTLFVSSMSEGVIPLPQAHLIGGIIGIIIGVSCRVNQLRLIPENSFKKVPL